MISVRKISEDDFLTLKEEWNQLLINSNSDYLFLSWDWLCAWWMTWRNKIYKAELFIILVYENAELIGIAPFYKDVRVIKKLLFIERIQFLGTAYQSIATIRTEYLSIIARPDCEDLVYRQIIDFLEHAKWDELVFKDVIKHKAVYKNFLLENNSFPLVRQVGADFGYKINTDEHDFGTFLRNLGKNTRLKLFNRRQRLAGAGTISLEYYGAEHKLEMFNLLNDFHCKRWGVACFSTASINFHSKVIDSLELNDCFSILKLNGDSVSILYNITMGNRVYNVQSGYVENAYKDVSFGTLHLGYELERCFDNKAVKYFDLLAGLGKNSDYKKRFNGERIEFISFQVVKTRWLCLLYKIKDFILNS